MTERKKFGPHQLWYEPDTGFICVVQVGTMGEEEARELVDFVLEQAAQTPGEPTFTLTDNRRATGLTSGARKVMTTSRQADTFEGYIAMFGTSFAMRAVTNLLFKAVAFAGVSKLTVNAFSTEAEARAWLTEHRLAYLARTRRA
ncbi:MAG TPA: STAS/SEC14 domain-containing protein [Labilithrix sp.]|jgi:hypothetical protein|nr:STAS/SEC14 domain-containing protein [Labilithrix sp.]